MKEGSHSIITKTLGDLYLKQGFKIKARRIYQQLLEMNPGDDELKERIRSTYVVEKANVRTTPVAEPTWMYSKKDQERTKKVIQVLIKWLEELDA